MAQKKITDLQLRSSVTDGVNFPSDDGIQSYRVTAAQIFAYMRTKFGAVQTITAAGTTLTSAAVCILLDPTSLSFTQNLPALATIPDGTVWVFKMIAGGGNTVTLDASGAELIDAAGTLELGSSPVLDSVTLLKTTTKWLVI